tara:strand:- start:794 stop:1168 length:375 start_codon:yes stop_codon:yes gene_type:complete
MNLQWELTDVINSDTLCWDERPDGKYQLKDLTESIINLTALVGINKITPKTAKEFGKRLGILKIIGMPIPAELNQGILNQHIGLVTTAPRLEYRGFKNRVFDSLETASKGALDYNADKAEAPST